MVEKINQKHWDGDDSQLPKYPVVVMNPEAALQLSIQEQIEYYTSFVPRFRGRSCGCDLSKISTATVNALSGQQIYVLMKNARDKCIKCTSGNRG